MAEEKEKLSAFRFEVCANSIKSCIAAQQGGADRIELCSGLADGGLTPSYAVIEEARKALSIKLHVIIRPRGGDFLYSPQELDIMANDIRMAHELKADGVVFGCLTQEGDVDTNACKRLIEAAGDMSITFHRAFDCCRNPEKNLNNLIYLGVNRILTSGLASSAEGGIPMLQSLNRLANGNIIVLAGCGVNESNIARIYEQTGIHEYHFSARESYPSLMKYHNPNVYMGLPGADEYRTEETSAEKVRRTIQALVSTLS